MRWLSVLAFVVGCGSVTAKPDAGGGSGDGGGSGSDAQTVGDATFELKLGGVATAGKAVVFSNPDGTLAKEATTDAGGLATATIMTGAMVTVAVDSNTLVSIGGVKPGDHIILKNPPPFDTTPAGIVSFGAASEATNKAYYRADLGADNYTTVQTMTSGTRQLNLTRGNLDANGKLSLAAAVYDAADRVIAYTFLTNVTPTLGQTTTVTLPAYMTDVVNMTVMLSGAPSDATKLSVDSANEQAGALYVPSSFGGLDSATVSNGAATVTVPYLGSFGDFVQTTAYVTFPTTTDVFTFTRRQPRPAGAYTLTASSMPPRIGMAAVDASTLTRPKLTWTLTGNAASGDAIATRLSWHNGANVQFVWHAYLPPDATTVTFPVVGTAMMAQAPNDTSFLSGLRVAHEDFEPLGGFDAFRIAPPLDFANPVIPTGMTSWIESETNKSL